MRFSVYQESKKGGRRVNQDRMGYLYTRDSMLILVAVGMGGPLCRVSSPCISNGLVATSRGSSRKGRAADIMGYVETP